jgi:hypothetical protein
MASEFENALKNVAGQITTYVKDVATLTVETKYAVVGAGGADEVHSIARTVIKLDGDSETTVPMRPAGAGQLEVDTALLEVHQRNVDTAIEYRARIMASLLDALRAARS